MQFECLMVVIINITFFWNFTLGSLSLVSTTEELYGRKSSGSGLESRDYGRRDP
jgi:hypothetical protein